MNLTTLWLRLKTLLAYEPAVASWASAGGLALLLAYLFHLTSTEEAAVTTIAAALATVYTAVRARPSDVPAIIGALTTLTGAATAFGFHPPPHVTGAVAALVALMLSVMLRSNLTPAAELKRQNQAIAEAIKLAKPVTIMKPPM